MREFLIRQESDVYEVAIVVYEARSYYLVLPGPRGRSYAISLDFDRGDAPLRVART